MHRSGTSATTRVLNLLGAELGENLMGPGYSNDQGFWEHMDAYQINDRLLHELGMSWSDPRRMPEGWEDTPQFAHALREIVQVLQRDFPHAPLWAVKDPRICRLVPLWQKALAQQKVTARAVIVVRHPDEIAGSLAVRDGLSRSQVHLLWARHLCEAERATRGMPRCVIRYDRLLRDWRAELARAGEDLGLVWPVDFDHAAGQIDAFLDKGSRHHVVEKRPSHASNSWIDGAFQAFASVSVGGEWAEASAWVDEFDRAAHVCDAYLDQAMAELGSLIAERSRYDDRVSLLDAARQEMKTSLTEQEARWQAGLAGLPMSLEARQEQLIHAFKTQLVDSEESASASLREASDAIIGQLRDTMADVRQEAADATARADAMGASVAELARQISQRNEELDRLHAEAARLRLMLDASRLETQRQRHAFSIVSAELRGRVESAAACAFLQAGVIWEKEREVALLASELDATKQNLDSAIRLADNLNDRLMVATRPWYKKLLSGSGTTDSMEAK